MPQPMLHEVFSSSWTYASELQSNGEHNEAMEMRPSPFLNLHRLDVPVT